MKTAFSLVGACLLAGCSVPLIRPNAQQTVAEQYSTAKPAGSAALDVNWWSRIGDPQLTELLSLAQTNSPDLRSAAASVMSARAQAGQSRADFFPSVTGQASSTVSDSDAGRRSETSSMLLDASWEVDLLGRVRNASRADITRAEAEEMSYAGSYVSLAAEVADDYVEYRACRLAEADYREARASQQETLEATRSLVDAGMSANSDLSLAGANVASAQINLTQQHADCQIAAQSLAKAVGVSQGQIDAILAKGGGLPKAKPFQVAAVPADMLRQRPDVIEAEKRFAASLLDLKVAQANLYPSLTLGGSVTLSDATSWSFGPALSLPILDGGASKSKVRVANADALTAAESYRSAVLTAVAEVEGALTRLAAARANVASAESLVQQYQAYFDAVDEDWKAGGASLLDREEARRQVQSARITRITQRRTLLGQWITLYKAVGGGWVPPTQLSPAKSKAAT
ncbi:efflux transporter outer membrane subunit [Pseudooceanicola spongiae]|uniref:Efflux transporter outer membrane subunit n=1 Tax=Pseudooceanicola spongiae TaxID=2613965 RepID=A0A7L9WKL9_9RHOB|nr:efflux transporter outer membrane subunit [Pseudooceanicola spongiae]QOL80374.1 efflux transporter outer membrane subunit [Pseudooceanicola spongiae]